MKKKDVIIIGAGASGLMCAAECGKRGRSVLVLDHADRTGSKIRISGGGRCNFTNLHISSEHYVSQNSHFCRSALARFTPRDFLELIKKHTVRYYEKEAGQLFCAGSSRDIIVMLQREYEHSGAEILLQCGRIEVRKHERFQVSTGEGEFQAESLVVATGGLSYAKLGATGFGHEVARQFGLRITPLRPALVPFTFSAKDKKAFHELAGISLNALVASSGVSFRGNILFTHRGLSGPAILRSSLVWKPGAPVFFDLSPDADLFEMFKDKRQTKIEMRTVLAGHFPKRFAQAWCERMELSKPMNQYSDKELREVADRLHAWEITPAGTEGYENAEVTSGGVDTAELSSKTMESKKVSGLYFIGEVVDVTGQLGGYNLHWAWASGHAAGQYA